MEKFNLSKTAAKSGFKNYSKMLEDNVLVPGGDVAEKNINLSLPVKDKDNTVPFNQQLEASRKNETKVSITEADMSDKIVNFGEKTNGIMPINAKTEEFTQKHADDFKKAQDSPGKDTAFWDKYVGVQLEGEGQPTKVKDNIPASSSQLQNQADRLKGEDVEKMVMASVKDADAMLFHIHATAAKNGRELNSTEQQQIIDINSGKARLLTADHHTGEKFPIVDDDIVIIQNSVGEAIVYHGKTPIDNFNSVQEAKSNYPEGDIK